VRCGLAGIPSSARGWIHKTGNHGLIKLVFSNRHIVLRIAEQLSTHLADLQQRLTDLTFKALAERLAATLCQLARHNPGEPIRLTHQQLVALVGATRERTTTALGELTKHDLIPLRRGKIIVRNPAPCLPWLTAPRGARPDDHPSVSER
jgi:hypothetical protein